MSGGILVCGRGTLSFLSEHTRGWYPTPLTHKAKALIKIIYYRFRKLRGQNPQDPSRRSSLRRNSQEQLSFHCLVYKMVKCKVSGSCYCPSWSILFTNNLVSRLSMYYLIFEGESLLCRLSFWFPDGTPLAEIQSWATITLSWS